jgi:hypothetical protein
MLIALIISASSKPELATVIVWVIPAGALGLST